MIEKREHGILYGAPSYCTANELALEAVLRRSAVRNAPVLIEATANQVNQFGGYTGMKPAEYYRKVLRMAEQAGVPEEHLILGGDHLGPLTWRHLPEKEAMPLANELVRQYVLAGFTKIHLDTSMKVADDPEGLLSIRTIARRGAELYRTCITAYKELQQNRPDAPRPVFVIGSEVPIPGGAQEETDSLAVTSPRAFRDTIKTYREAFAREGMPDGMKDVIAVVVQPGVEYGDDQIFDYNRKAAHNLCAALNDYPGIVFEGHSTDYQSARHLREMVEDGIMILKVGPALTFGLREALFAMAIIEKELVPEEEQAHLIEVLDAVMVRDPGNWKNHYHGDEKQLALARKYSFSDRARYYIGQKEVQDEMEKMFSNLRRCSIPMNMLHQYLPSQYWKIRSGELKNDPMELAIDGVNQFVTDYEYAAEPHS